MDRAAWCCAKRRTASMCRWRCCINCSLESEKAMILNRNDQALAIGALRRAAPYIRMYKGKTFVVKVGGGVFENEESTRGLIEQISILHYFGVRVVLVHG